MIADSQMRSLAFVVIMCNLTYVAEAAKRTNKQIDLARKFHECLKATNTNETSINEHARLVLQQQSVELSCGICPHPDRLASDYRVKWRRVLQASIL